MEYIDSIFKIFDSYTQLAMTVHLLENVMWNLGDVLQNLIEARTNLENKDFKAYGQNAGQIVSDFFFVSPVDNTIWTEENSRIINGDGTSEKVPSSYYGELKVGSSRKQIFNSQKSLIE